MTKVIDTRIIHTHDLEVNWLSVADFIPMQGEIIIYDAEVDAAGNTLLLPQDRTAPYHYERFKIGDGKTSVNKLPFSGIVRSGEGLASTLIGDTGYTEIDGVKIPHISATGQYAIAIGTTHDGEGKQTYMEASGDGSHAEGAGTKAQGKAAHAEGARTVASGSSSHSEGHNTQAVNEASHAEGYGSTAQGKYSHAEGWETISDGISAHTEGYKAKAEGNYGHAEGYNTVAGVKGEDTATAHAEGYGSKALGHSSHAEGRSTQALAYASHAEGRGTIAEQKHSHAEGYSTQAKGENSHAEGTYVVAFGAQSHAEGRGQTSTDVITDGVVTNIGYSSGVAISNATHIEGYMSIAGQMGYYIDSIDFTNTAAPVITLSKTRETPAESFRLCLFEGEVADNMVAKNEYQVGDYVTIVNGNVFANCATITSINDNVITTTALPFTTFEKTSPDSYIKNYTLCVNAKPRIGATDLGEDAHAEGRTTKALHFCAHAEGDNCIVTGKASHAEGHSTKAYGPSAHSENWGSEAHGANSHAGGSNCKSIGNSSFAHGQNSQANGISSFVFGIGLIASGDHQTVVGQYNEPVADALFIVGCGTATARANAFVVYKDGTTWTKQQHS